VRVPDITVGDSTVSDSGVDVEVEAQAAIKIAAKMNTSIGG
jgi:hypothetical protein